MQIYSVFLWLDLEIENDWLEYMLGQHIKDVMNTGCFIDWKLLKDTNCPDETKAAYRMDYRLESSEKMDEYIKVHSAELKNDVIMKFGDKFTAQRSIYDVISD